MVVTDFLNIYDFLKSIMFKFAEKPDGERVKGSHPIPLKYKTAIFSPFPLKLILNVTLLTISLF